VRDQVRWPAVLGMILFVVLYLAAAFAIAIGGLAALMKWMLS